jgi:hypothetical protein
MRDKYLVPTLRVGTHDDGTPHFFVPEEPAGLFAARRTHSIVTLRSHAERGNEIISHPLSLISHP